jgi:hypothetical protein
MRPQCAGSPFGNAPADLIQRIRLILHYEEFAFAQIVGP